MSATTELPRRILVAIGGNATHPENITGTSEQQKQVAADAAQAMLPLALADNELVIVHGNGPVVGKILLRQALTADRVPPMSLDICVAHSQGGIAYLLVQAIENALREAGSARHAACLLTQVEVDPNDPAFANPTKFVGTFYTREQADRISAELGWPMKQDSNRGFRHVVPSPPPKHICDISLVEVLARRGTIVIAGGGGGIPVVRQPNGVRHGVEAVIDKDLTAALMASVLRMDTLLILTSIDKVAVDYGKPTQRWLETVRVSELRRYRDQGQFPPGSMGPKIEAAISFLERGGKRAIIAALREPMAALEGRAGTQIIPDDD